MPPAWIPSAAAASESTLRHLVYAAAPQFAEQSSGGGSGGPQEITVDVSMEVIVEWTETRTNEPQRRNSFATFKIKEGNPPSVTYQMIKGTNVTAITATTSRITSVDRTPSTDGYRYKANSVNNPDRPLQHIVAYQDDPDGDHYSCRSKTVIGWQEKWIKNP